MFKALITLATLTCIIFSSFLFADGCCCQSADVSVGWRRDYLHWKTSHLHSDYIPATAHSKILFKNIDIYTVSGKAKWTGSEYYIRLSADYGLTDKGRAHERFGIKSPCLLYDPIEVKTRDPIKRRSEVYDFNIAAGYPLAFFCCRLSIVPLIGFSYHRQHLRVRGEKQSFPSQCSFDPRYDSCFRISSEESGVPIQICGLDALKFSSISADSSFSVRHSNPFRHSPSSNPFSSSSESSENIAYELGLSNHHRSSNYRFTWYGFYLGTDIAYALDSCWTLFSELEFHFLDNCHRKRKSWTGVSFVDSYHHKGWAYGFNGVFGCTYAFSTCWYSIVSVDFKWWKGDSTHDTLCWKTVGVNVGLGYMF